MKRRAKKCEEVQARDEKENARKGDRVQGREGEYREGRKLAEEEREVQGSEEHKKLRSL